MWHSSTPTSWDAHGKRLPGQVAKETVHLAGWSLNLFWCFSVATWAVSGLLLCRVSQVWRGCSRLVRACACHPFPAEAPSPFPSVVLLATWSSAANWDHSPVGLTLRLQERSVTLGVGSDSSSSAASLRWPCRDCCPSTCEKLSSLVPRRTGTLIPSHRGKWFYLGSLAITVTRGSFSCKVTLPGLPAKGKGKDDQRTLYVGELIILFFTINQDGRGESYIMVYSR